MLRDRVMFMSGGSRGIGLAIAARAARDGIKVALMAKTSEPHPKLPGTIHTAAQEIEEAGGEALPIVGDIRDADAVTAAVQQTVERFGGIDLVVNNASAINLAPMRDLEVKRFDLMQQINARGTFVVTRACLPHLRESDHAHVLTHRKRLHRRRGPWRGGHPRPRPVRGDTRRRAGARHLRRRLARAGRDALGTTRSTPR